MFRKVGSTIQTLTSMDVAGDGKMFLTQAQMIELAKVVAGRL